VCEVVRISAGARVCVFGVVEQKRKKKGDLRHNPNERKRQQERKQATQKKETPYQVRVHKRHPIVTLLADEKISSTRATLDSLLGYSAVDPSRIPSSGGGCLNVRGPWVWTWTGVGSADVNEWQGWHSGGER
jgi:hypothetical protein